jgi:hypothetical protein
LTFIPLLAQQTTGFSPIPQTQPRPVGTVQAVARPPPAQAGRPAPPQAARPVPFTAFRNGLPPQQAGAPRPQLQQVGAPRPQVPQQFQGQRPVFQQPFQIQRPGGSPFTAFAQRPGQPQARPPPGFAVRPPPQGFQQRPEQFRTAGGPPARFAARPAGTPPGFSVFNPAALRGARF